MSRHIRVFTTIQINQQKILRLLDLILKILLQLTNPKVKQLNFSYTFSKTFFINNALLFSNRVKQKGFFVKNTFT